MSLWSKIKNVINKPAKIAGETFYDFSKQITGSEKLSSAGARMFAVSTSALGGDPLPFRSTLTAEDVGANPTLFRTGRQAGDIVGTAIGSLFVGGAVLGGGSLASGSGATVSSGVVAGSGAGAGSTLAVAGGGSSTIWPWIASGATGIINSVFGALKKVGESSLTSLVEREGKDIFGMESSSGGGGGTGAGDTSGFSGLLSGSMIPILIILTLLGAFILTRKKGRK